MPLPIRCWMKRDTQSMMKKGGLFMGFRVDMEEELPNLLKEIGENALFTPAGGDPIPCVVDIRRNTLYQPAGMETQVWERGTTIEVQLSVIGRGPKPGETFTIGSVVYTVRSILVNDDDYTVKLAVT